MAGKTRKSEKEGGRSRAGKEEDTQVGRSRSTVRHKNVRAISNV